VSGLTLVVPLMVRSKGKLSPMLTGKKVFYRTLSYHSGDLHINYRTPFEPKSRNAELHDLALPVVRGRGRLEIEHFLSIDTDCSTSYMARA
jgi:hypothetical protein